MYSHPFLTTFFDIPRLRTVDFSSGNPWQAWESAETKKQKKNSSLLPKSFRKTALRESGGKVAKKLRETGNLQKNCEIPAKKLRETGNLQKNCVATYGNYRLKLATRTRIYFPSISPANPPANLTIMQHLFIFVHIKENRTLHNIDIHSYSEHIPQMLRRMHTHAMENMMCQCIDPMPRFHLPTTSTYKHARLTQLGETEHIYTLIRLWCNWH